MIDWFSVRLERMWSMNKLSSKQDIANLFCNEAYARIVVNLLRIDYRSPYKAILDIFPIKYNFANLGHCYRFFGHGKWDYRHDR
jgi:hypothetical protein